MLFFEEKVDQILRKKTGKNQQNLFYIQLSRLLVETISNKLQNVLSELKQITISGKMTKNERKFLLIPISTI